MVPKVPITKAHVSMVTTQKFKTILTRADTSSKKGGPNKTNRETIASSEYINVLQRSVSKEQAVGGA